MITIETFHKAIKPVKNAALIAIFSMSIIMLFGCGKDDTEGGSQGDGTATAIGDVKSPVTG